MIYPNVYPFTDNYPVLRDNDGNLLVGRVKFYAVDSTEYKTIYSDPAHTTAISNPQYVTLNGRTDTQVFLYGGLYKIVIEKYLGDTGSDMTLHALDIS